ncbi:DUF6320 domain-containing protein [Peloplasma aerotolerans]|jgi:hypothetical protein|uniref:DUF6320 domain-containing protein n=1 Tax=Peloplasma aerotolerans TaxID=3044389 RepID=A0AAW6UAA2_9MOLU|nr:DUF6320 domain-containing protein [Mariniplasma sp. M4Ah]MDI6453644.1 DUF6320 domain-containing protein [Mariniplasma sp. M4Ah]MDR4968587.1 DUF6320 domain-containing protein [Acholeplasmataceae bacterium]
MKYCKTCKVHYDTDLKHCLLCNGELEHEGDVEPIYKFTEVTNRSKSKFYLRLFYFLNIISAIVVLYLDYMSGTPLTWSLIVSITNAYVVIMFTVLTVPTIWISKLTKGIILTVASVVLVGLAIRDHSWALDYVLPLAITANIFLISILIIVNKKKWFDYFASLSIITVIGLVPGLFNLLNLTTVMWPSMICFSFSAFTLLGIIFLPSKSSREEFRRRFHI